MSDKVYFNLKDFFNETSVDTGDKFHVDVNSIEVDGVEQLTSDYFSETTRYNTHVFGDAVNPHTSNIFEFSKCTQLGAYPDPTSINACNLAGSPNSYNPFAHFLNVNYNQTVDGVKRGDIQDSVSGNYYGIEPFGFGFDKIDVPINDVAGGGNGSTGASIDGAFYLNIDYTKNLTINIWITKWDSVGNKLWTDQHTISHLSSRCSFRVEVRRENFYPTASIEARETVTQIGHLTGGLSGWIVPRCSQVVDPCEPEVGTQEDYVPQADNFYLLNGENGAIYSPPSGYSDIGQTWMKIVTATNTISYVGSYNDCQKPVFSQNTNKIYCLGKNADAKKVIILDTSNDSVTVLDFTTELGSDNFQSFGEGVSFGNHIYFPPNKSNAGDPVLKYDTNTDTFILIASPATGSARYFEGRLGDNDRIYFFAQETYTSPQDILVIEPLNSDNMYKTGSITGFWTPLNDENGNIYGIPWRGTNLVKIATNPTGETVTSIDKSSELGSLPNIAYRSMVLGEDGIGYSAPYFTTDNTLVFDPATENFSFILHYTGATEYGSGALGDNGFIYWLKAGLLSGSPSTGDRLMYFNTPDCTDQPIGEPFCDCIVTQSIGLLASKRDEPVSLFVDAKECCYHSPVFGDLGDSVSYKNDINSFLYKRDFSSETIDFVLLKDGGVANGGSDIPLLNNDYGTYYNFGSLDDYPDYKGYQIEWRKVLNLLGEGDYQMQVTSNLVTGTFVDESVPFKLRAYDPDLVHGTVRIQSVMNGYLRNRDFNYKGLNWLDGIRFEGMFGNRQAEYEEERIIYTNRQARQLRSELINKYNLKSMHLPSCITDIVLEYHNLSNKMLITDYNSVNHKVYIEKEVILDTVNSIEYPVVANTAPLDITYKDYVQDYNKSNC